MNSRQSRIKVAGVVVFRRDSEAGKWAIEVRSLDCSTVFKDVGSKTRIHLTRIVLTLLTEEVKFGSDQIRVWNSQRALNGRKCWPIRQAVQRAVNSSTARCRVIVVQSWIDEERIRVVQNDEVTANCAVRAVPLEQSCCHDS